MVSKSDVNSKRIEGLTQQLSSRSQQLGKYLLALEKVVLNLPSDYKVDFGTKKHAELFDMYLRGLSLMVASSEAARRSCVTDMAIREQQQNKSDVLVFIERLRKEGVEAVRLAAARGEDSTINNVLASAILKGLEGDGRSATFVLQTLMGLQVDMPAAPKETPGLIVNLKEGEGYMVTRGQGRGLFDPQRIIEAEAADAQP